jgi:hypothetical protein
MKRKYFTEHELEVLSGRKIVRPMGACLELFSHLKDVKYELCDRKQLERWLQLSESTYFVNGIPALCEALEKAGRGKEAQALVKQFLISSFNEDLDKKAERLRKLPCGIFPVEMEYFKVFWELNQIYIAGLYYITVVATGVLCERMCYDILAKNSVKAKDGLGLFELIKLITENKLAKTETLVEMEAIRKKRNEYVHPEKKITNTERDASEMIERISKVLHNEFAV